jgi:aminoglycoside/choline kinase family phosphotransferase
MSKCHMAEFPRRLSEITAAWLSVVLGGTSALERVDVTRIGEGRGMLGALARIRLVGERGSLPETVVAKLHADRAALLEIARRSNHHRREVMFFADLAGQCPARVPKCFGHWYDDETAEFLLLLEDIDADLSIDQVDGLDVDRARDVIDELALLHARWWRDESLRSSSWLQGFDTPARRMNLPTISASGWPSLAALLDARGELSDAERAAGARLAEHLRQMLDLLGPMPATLVHGDLRLDNILFAQDGPVIVDWQGTCVAPPSLDLAYFLSQSMSTATRRAHSAELLTRYGEGVRRAGCAATDEELFAGLGTATWFALGAASSLCAIGDREDPRTDVLAMTMGRRALDALHDHGEIV